MSPKQGQPVRIGARYEVVRMLGKGAFGAVYLCDDTELHRPVAVKVLHPGRKQAQILPRFQREARAAAMLQHPHVVTVFEQGTTERGEPFLVTEYVEGESLSEYLRRQGPPPPELGARWVGQLSEALQAAHELGILHRDIKPANVLLRDGDALLADFGLARIESEDVTRMTETGQIMGTPLYMAPEVFLGEEVDQRSDVYSLATVAYYVMYGERWRTGDLQALLTEAREEEPPDPQRFGRYPTHDDGLLWGLQPRPARRAPTAQAFRESFLGEVSLPTTVAVQRKKTRRPRTPLVLAGLAVVGVALGAWSSRAPSPASPPAPLPSEPATASPARTPEPDALRRAREALELVGNSFWEGGVEPPGYKERTRQLVPVFLEPTMPLRFRRLAREVEEAARSGADFEAGAVALDRFAERWWTVEDGLQDYMLTYSYDEDFVPLDVKKWKQVSGELADLARSALESLETLPPEPVDATLLVWVRLSLARLMDSPRAGEVALQAAAHLPAARPDLARQVSQALKMSVHQGNTTSRLGPDGDLATTTWLARSLPPSGVREPYDVWAEVAGDALYCAARVIRRRLRFTPAEGLAAFDRLLEHLWRFREVNPALVRKGLRASWIRLKGRSMLDEDDAGEASVRLWVLKDRLEKIEAVLED